MPEPDRFRLARQPAAKPTPTPPPAASSGHTVLVVDDVKAIAQTVSDLLRKNGFSVESTLDAVEALAWVTKLPGAFDVIVSDLEMPEMTGLVLLERARGAGFQGKTVLHSGRVTETDVAQLLLSVDAVVLKPFETRTLPDILRKLLG